MTSFVLTTGILFGLNIVSFPCKGQINLPPGGSWLLGGWSVVVAPGDDATIAWTFKNTLTEVKSRFWSFKSSSPGSTLEDIALIDRSGKLVYNSSLGLHPRVDIKDEATLVLKNVSSLHDGTYTFAIVGGGDTDISDVRLFIAKAPNATVCSSPVTVDEGENVTCLCKGENGNPPATVKWYRAAHEIGDTTVKENMLSLGDITGADSGTYKCVAQSYKTFKDEKSIELTVNYAPDVTSLEATAVLGKSVTITCEAGGHPEPTYTIYHNMTGKNVSAKKTYTIGVVKYSDAGSYLCVASNRLGNSSKTFNLTVIGPAPPTTTMPLQTTNSSKKARVTTTNAYICNDVENESVVVWHVVVSLLCGFIIGFLLSCIVGYLRCRSGNRKPSQSNPEPQTSSNVDSIYQDLDLSKMNQEENYQTLRAANSGNESEYTELNLARDVEDNYQTLTST